MAWTSESLKLRVQVGLARVSAVRAVADRADDCVEVVERDLEPFEDMGALAGLLELDTAVRLRDDLVPVIDVVLEHALEGQHAWLVAASTSASMLTPKVVCMAVCL